MAGTDEAVSTRPDSRGLLGTLVRLDIGADAITWAALAVGVALRVWGYADGRPLYMDERSLLRNLVLLPVFDFHTTLVEFQLAPPGFLVIERMVVRLPGSDMMAGRMVALVFGIASLFLFRSVARRLLLPAAVPMAMGLFALSDWLIYYSAEIKQYSCDLALGLAALLLTLRAGPAPERANVRGLVALAAFGAAGVWFSHPLVLVLAAVGTYLLGGAVIRRDPRGIVILAGMGAAWLVSFAACYVVSHGILSKESFIWDWWDFAFLPIPPRSGADLRKDFWSIANLFDSPSDVRMPLGMIPTAIVAMALWIIGGVVARAEAAGVALSARGATGIHAGGLGAAAVPVPRAAPDLPGAGRADAGGRGNRRAGASGRPADGGGCSGRSCCSSRWPTRSGTGSSSRSATSNSTRTAT